MRMVQCVLPFKANGPPGLQAKFATNSRQTLIRFGSLNGLSAADWLSQYQAAVLMLSIVDACQFVWFHTSYHGYRLFFDFFSSLYFIQTQNINVLFDYFYNLRGSLGELNAGTCLLSYYLLLVLKWRGLALPQSSTDSYITYVLIG